MTRRLRSTIALAIAVVATAAIILAMPAAAAPTASSGAPPSTARSLDLFPTEIALPNGWLPEEIAIGVFPIAFFGSRADGDIYRVNLVTGNGSVFSRGSRHAVGRPEGRPPRPAARRRGHGRDGRVVDAIPASHHRLNVATAPTFVNDVVLTPDAAWLTKTRGRSCTRSARPLRRAADQGEVEAVPFGAGHGRATGSPARPTATRCS